MVNKWYDNLKSMYTCSKPSTINEARRLEKLFFLFTKIRRRRILESAPLIYFQKLGGDVLFKIHLDTDSRTIHESNIRCDCGWRAQVEHKLLVERAVIYLQQKRQDAITPCRCEHVICLASLDCYRKVAQDQHKMTFRLCSNHDGMFGKCWDKDTVSTSIKATFCVWTYLWITRAANENMREERPPGCLTNLKINQIRSQQRKY